MAGSYPGPDEGAKPTRLVLVRHGESEASVRQVVGGPTGCTGLSPLGLSQAEALCHRLATTGEVQPDVLLASTLPRARQTAEIIAPALGGLPVDVDPDLCELHPGECDGIGWGDFRERYGTDFEVDPYQPLSPGGESWAEFMLRVGRTLHRLARQHEGRTVVLACHGGIVAGSLHAFFNLGTQQLPPFELEVTNTSLTEWVEVRRPEGRSHWRLLRYNDAAHLAGLSGVGEPAG